ncbi:MAG: endonuclease/exonuclease/phosphatase family protein, partial [Bdellovibrionota bacterium]
MKAHLLLFLLFTVGFSQEPSAALNSVTADPLLPKELQICSFNIQFLGLSNSRDSVALANYIKNQNCDLIVVQELIAPPDLNKLTTTFTDFSDRKPFFLDGTPYRADTASSSFFGAMAAVGYTDFWLSEEDTGTSKKNKSNGSNTEWWVVFYRADKVKPAEPLQNISGFLDVKLAANPTFDRVPYSFAFQTLDEKFDFVLINVHLHPGPAPRDRDRRLKELRGIYSWIDEAKKISNERDFIIIGDMNIEHSMELSTVLLDTPFVSLNVDAKTYTNTNIKKPKPYDHVLLDPSVTTEINHVDNFFVADLIESMSSFWLYSQGAYPGKPYVHDNFRWFFSDHHLVHFKAVYGALDD